jgi:predicted solute-binding protein
VTASEGDEFSDASVHGRRLGLAPAETADYLRGFNYRIGDREREAIEAFRALIGALPGWPVSPRHEEETWN